MKAFLKALIFLAVLFYPFAIYYGLGHVSTRYLLLFIACAFLIRFLVLNKQSSFFSQIMSVVILVAGLSVCTIGIAFNSVVMVKIYPVFLSLVLFVFFFYSLWHPPSVIERIARLKNPNLPIVAIRYTRKVTMVWCGFFILNGSISLWTAYFENIKIWTLYNGFISYLLMGLLFTIEYLIRCYLQKKQSIKSDCVERLIPLLKKSPEAVLFQHLETSYQAKACLSDIAHIQKKLLPGKQRYALCFSNHYTFTVALLAVLTSHLDPVLLPNNQQGCLQELSSAYDVILTDMDSVFMQKQHSCIFIKAFSHETVTEWESVKNLSGEQRITFFTSGSTGQPKQVSRTLKQLGSEIAALEALFGADMQGDIFSTVSHQHLYGFLFYILWPLCSGRIINLLSIDYPEQIATLSRSNQSFVLITSPAILKRMEGVSPLNNPITVFSSGGLLKASVSRMAYGVLGVFPIEILGSTETGAVAYRTQKNGDLWQKFPEIILKPDLKSGALLIENSPFFDNVGPFCMSDRANFHPDGRFELQDRIDRLVKIEEKRVSLTEIEKRLQTNDYVAHAYAVKIEENREYIGVAIVLTADGVEMVKQAGKADLSKQLRVFLSAYFEPLVLPKKFRYVSELPMNSQGKFILSELKKLF